MTWLSHNWLDLTVALVLAVPFVAIVGVVCYLLIVVALDALDSDHRAPD